MRNYSPIVDSPPFDVNTLHAADGLDVESDAADFVCILISDCPSRVLNEKTLILIHLRGLAALQTEADGVGVQIIIGSGVLVDGEQGSVAHSPIREDNSIEEGAVIVSGTDG